MSFYDSYDSCEPYDPNDPYDVQDVSAEIALRLGDADIWDPDCWDQCFPPESEEDQAPAVPWKLAEDPVPAMDQWPDSEFSSFKKGHNALVFDNVERMLGHLHKRVDPRPTTDRLRVCMGSARTMYRSDRHVFQLLGVHHIDALAFSIIPDFCRFVESRSYGEHPQIGRFMFARDYVAAQFIGRQDEHLYLFCINARGTLKEPVVLHRGVEDRAIFSMPRLMMEVMRYRPSAVLLAHNHPGGTMRPSQDDILCTRQVIDALTLIGIPLLDHLIIAERQAISMRENGFIPECVWMSQHPKHYLLRNWLLPPPPKKPKKPKVLTPEQQAAAAARALRARRREWLHQISMARALLRRSKADAERAMKVYRRMQAKENAYRRAHPEEFPPKKKH